MNFEGFHFNPAVAAGILKAGYATPTPIQTQAIPTIMKDRDLIGRAQTGTGKTAAFVLPMLHRLIERPRDDRQENGPRALILAPTRELAEQIHQTIRELGLKTRLKSVAIYGGVSIIKQMQNLGRADIIVACPGRLLDHIGRKTVNLSRLEVLVIDEADLMFDMGFLPDVRKILARLPRQRQSLLFSATMPAEIRKLSDEILKDPVIVQIGTTAPAQTVSHALYPVAGHLKTALLLNLLETTTTQSVLVFTRTKHRARTLEKKLTMAGYRSASLQGNLSQARRQAALDGFRLGKIQILVATDIASRGIDVTRVSHVINYDIPSTPEAYIHRIGRTGRAERTGEAFTLITGEDRDMVNAINRVIGAKIEQRTLAAFNYKAPAAAGEERAQRPQKQHHGFAGAHGRSRRGKDSSRSYARAAR